MGATITATTLSRKLGFHPSWLPRLVKENRQELKELGLVIEEQRGRRRRWYIPDPEAFVEWLRDKGYHIPEL